MAKFISPETEKKELEDAMKQRSKNRREHILHKKPIWETWGTDEHNPENAIGFFGQKEVFGNNLEGREWI